MNAASRTELPKWTAWIAFDSDGQAHAFDRCPRYHPDSGTWRTYGLGVEVARIGDPTLAEKEWDLVVVHGYGNGRLFRADPKPRTAFSLPLWALVLGGILLAAGMGIAPEVLAWLRGDAS